MTDAPTTPDPIEIAMEAEAHDAAPDSPARTLLQNQNRLVLWQIASERAGFALKVLIGLAGLAAAAGFGAMAWSASQADGVVVEAFSTPPALAEKGLTGAVVAGEVLDRLAALDRETFGRESLQLSDSWTVSSRVAIPQTGISIDELDRLLRRWLGHEAIVTGAVIETPGGVALTARTSRGAIVSAEGPLADLPRLALQMAEQLLAQAQPVRYGRLMLRRDRPDEAARILSDVAETSLSRRERADAYFNLGATYLRSEQLPQSAAAIRDATALGNTSGAMIGGWAEYGQGHAAAAEALFRRAMTEAGSKRPGSPDYRPRQALYDAAHHALAVGDYGLAERNFGEFLRGRLYRSGFDEGHYQDHIRALLGLHQTSAARRELPGVIGLLGDNPRARMFHRGLADTLAVAEQDWPAVLNGLDAGPASPSMIAAPTPDVLRAQALAHLGRLPEAQALAATLPTDCDRCLRARAEVAELVGDRAGADRWLAQALRIAPKIPFAETDWARMLLTRGDPDAAIVKARAAHARSPSFADPLEVWGEALLAKRDPHGAAAKFVAAARLAPRWGRLRLKAGEALAAMGDRPRAQAQWRWAAQMDLTPAERAELAKVSR